MTFNAKTKSTVGTWNVRTMTDPSTLAQATKEMNRYQLELLGLSETRWNGTGEFHTADGYTVLFPGKPVDEAHIHGVGILLSKNAFNSLITWNPVSERIIMVRLKTPIRNITVVQCYAPTEVSAFEMKADFFDQLTSTCFTIP